MEKSNKKEILFIGPLSGNKDAFNKAKSAAADQVQVEIISALNRLSKKDDSNLKIYSFSPAPSWPEGPFEIGGLKDKSYHWPKLINIVIIKQIIFSIKLMSMLLKIKPARIYVYNADAFQAFAIILYKKFYKSQTIAIIQDVLTYPHVSRIKSLGYKLSLRVIKGFSIIIAISKNIIYDFDLPKNKSFVFQGGCTRQSKILKRFDIKNLKNVVIYAGALEKYNGIDLVIKQWKSIDNYELHVFGKGSYEKEVISAARENKNIIFHGLCDEKTVSSYMAISKFNICLRYSENINQIYFFPSKFFNVMSAPGLPIFNNFINFPSSAKKLCVLVDDDLSNLKNIINENINLDRIRNNRFHRLQWLNFNASWDSIVSKTYVKLEY